jgi:hypothetical protein
MEATMSTTDAAGQTATPAGATGVAVRLEVVVIPVADVDAA